MMGATGPYRPRGRITVVSWNDACPTALVYAVVHFCCWSAEALVYAVQRGV